MSLPLCTRRPLADLGSARPELAGILSPGYTEELVNAFLHEAFTVEADTYLAQFQNLDLWRWILDGALARLDIDRKRPLRVLDIGSGAGNTIFPLFDLLSSAHVVASDLSIEMLYRLKRYWDQHYPLRTGAVVQLNAEDLPFADEQFDLVVGGAILHHLFDPSRALGECARVLKPGASAVFVEPFELGHALVGMMFEYLLVQNETKAVGDRLSEPVIELLKGMLREYDLRTGSDKSAEIYRSVDDKWLFAESYLRRVSREAGFSAISVYSIDDRAGTLASHFRTVLRLGIGASEESLPAWVAETVRRSDARLSDELRGEMILNGVVLFTK